MTRLSKLPALTVLSLAWLAQLVVWLGMSNPLRLICVLAFLLVGPGLAFVPLLRIGGWPGWTMAVGLSLALDTVVSTAMIYAGIWSPEATLMVLVMLSLIGAVCQSIPLSVSRKPLAGELR